MPTERFYRLPEEKKMSILLAAVDEFSRVPFGRVSINQIIKKAEISRGSFYTYFEDKTDVLRYIFQDTKTQYLEFCKQSLLKNHGDFWKMMEDIFRQILYREYTGRLAGLFKNVMAYAEAESFIKNILRGCEGGEKMDEWIYEHMDKSGMRLTSPEDFHEMMECCMLILLIAFAQKYKDNIELELIRRSFFRKMDMLKYGVLEHKEN